MTTTAGRRGALYVNLTSGGTAEPVAFLNEWDMDFDSDTYETTAFGDSNKTFVAGLPNGAGTFTGFYDISTPQTYTAASDGVARKFYAYVDRTITGSYWFGTGTFTFSLKVPVSGAAAISGKFSAASPIIKVG